jgi:hypothetical protein
MDVDPRARNGWLPTFTAGTILELSTSDCNYISNSNFDERVPNSTTSESLDFAYSGRIRTPRMSGMSFKSYEIESDYERRHNCRSHSPQINLKLGKDAE